MSDYMACALSTYNPHPVHTNSSQLIRGTAYCQCLHFSSRAQDRSRKASQPVSSLNRHFYYRKTYSERHLGLLFMQVEDWDLNNVCVSGIWPSSKINYGSICKRRQKVCCSMLSNAGLLSRIESSFSHSSRLWTSCVKCRHHILLYCFQSELRTNTRQRVAPVGASPSVSEASGITESGCFSLSNDELLSKGFALQSSYEEIDIDQLNSLFLKVGFPRRQKEKMTRALQHTLSLVWLKTVKSDKMIAFARATGDNVFNAIIWDVVVDPSYQGIGLGKAVIERLMADLVKRGISNIALYAEPQVVGFYKPLGFVSDPDGIRAMSYSQKRR